MCGCLLRRAACRTPGWRQCTYFGHCLMATAMTVLLLLDLGLTWLQYLARLRRASCLVASLNFPLHGCCHVYSHGLLVSLVIYVVVAATPVFTSDTAVTVVFIDLNTARRGALGQDLSDLILLAIREFIALHCKRLELVLPCEKRQ